MINLYGLSGKGRYLVRGGGANAVRYRPPYTRLMREGCLLISDTDEKDDIRLLSSGDFQPRDGGRVIKKSARAVKRSPASHPRLGQNPVAAVHILGWAAPDLASPPARRAAFHYQNRCWGLNWTWNPRKGNQTGSFGPSIGGSMSHGQQPASARGHHLSLAPPPLLEETRKTRPIWLSCYRCRSQACKQY